MGNEPQVWRQFCNAKRSVNLTFWSVFVFFLCFSSPAKLSLDKQIFLALIALTMPRFTHKNRTIIIKAILGQQFHWRWRERKKIHVKPNHKKHAHIFFLPAMLTKKYYRPIPTSINERLKRCNKNNLRGVLPFFYMHGALRERNAAQKKCRTHLDRARIDCIWSFNQSIVARNGFMTKMMYITHLAH